MSLVDRVNLNNRRSRMANKEVLFKFIFIDNRNRQRALPYKDTVASHLDFVTSGSDLGVQFVINQCLMKHIGDVESHLRRECVRCDRPALRKATLWTAEDRGSAEPEIIYHWILPVCGVDHFALAMGQLIMDGKPTYASHWAAAPMCHASSLG